MSSTLLDTQLAETQPTVETNSNGIVAGKRLPSPGCSPKAALRSRLRASHRSRAQTSF